MLCCYVCYSAMLCCCAVLLCYAATLFCYAMLICSAAMYAVLLCYAATLCCAAMVCCGLRQLVSSLQGKKIVQIGCGLQHTVALTAWVSLSLPLTPHLSFLIASAHPPGCWLNMILLHGDDMYGVVVVTSTVEIWYVRCWSACWLLILICPLLVPLCREFHVISRPFNECKNIEEAFLPRCVL